jgi:hypothetical protein
MKIYEIKHGWSQTIHSYETTQNLYETYKSGKFSARLALSEMPQQPKHERLFAGS